MSHIPRTSPANPLQVWMGVAAGILGGIGLVVYMFVPSQTRTVCSGLGWIIGSNLGSSLGSRLGVCPLHSAVQFVQPILVADLLELWGPVFLVVAVGAIWDGWRRALLLRVLLWIGTLLLPVVTVPGLFLGAIATLCREWCSP